VITESEFARLVREAKPPLPPAVREILRHYSGKEIIECVLAMLDNKACMAKSSFERSSKAAEDARAAAAIGLAQEGKTP
jgi:hypothetical protein